MVTQLREVSSHMVAAVAILVAGMMVTLLLKTPHCLMTYLAIASPCIWLIGIWTSHLVSSKALDAANGAGVKSGEGSPSATLRDRVDILAVFGLIGIGIGVSTGFILGRMAAH